MLAAQCTDERVNQVTPALFRRYPTARDYAAADLGELEEMVHATGFFRNKARALKNLGTALAAEHGGEVPASLEALVALPGVGRKTANVVLGNAFGRTEGIAVDTHVQRLSRRLFLTEEEDPEKIERDLMAILPARGVDALRPAAPGSRPEDLQGAPARMRRLRRWRTSARRRKFEERERHD